MIRLIAILAFLPALQAALSVTLMSVSNVDAMLHVTGLTGGDCAFTATPAIADINNSLYSGSNTCTGRATAKQALADGSGGYFVLIGSRVSDRSLTIGTTYTLTTTSGTDTVNSTFTPETLGLGNAYPWSPPFDDSRPANRGLALPRSILTTKSRVTDPLSGIVHYPAASATDITGRTGAVSFLTTSAPGTWTNPNNAVNGSTSTASTTGANVLDIYAQSQYDSTGTGWDVPFKYWGINDLGVKLWDKGSAAYTVQLYKLGAPCGNSLVLTPQSSSTFGLNAGSGLDSMWPSTFPTAFFSGWGGTCIIEQENRYMHGTLTTVTTAGTTTATVNSVSFSNHFSDTLVAGTPVQITGTSSLGCANNICHVATVIDTTKITLQEALSADVTNAAYVSMPWWIRVTPASSGLQLGIQLDIANGFMLSQPNPATPEHNCNPNTWVDGFGETVRLCFATGGDAGTVAYTVWAYGTDASGNPVSRFVWLGEMPIASFFNGGGHLSFPAADVPHAASSFFAGNTWWFQSGVGAAWDGMNPKKLYISMVAADGVTPDVYGVTYTGDLTESRSYNYGISGYVPNAGSVPMLGTDCTTTGSMTCEGLTWEVDVSTTNTLTAQVEAFDSFYSTNAALFLRGGWVLKNNGSGTSMFMLNLDNQDLAGIVAVMNTSSTPWSLVNVIDPLTGRGSNQTIRLGGIHAVTGEESFPNTTNLASNHLAHFDTTRPFTGPFQMPVIAVLKPDGVTWNSNTAIPNSNDGSYFSTCPATNPYTAYGATGNRCFTIQTSKFGWCNTFPSTAEKSAFPCYSTGISVSGWTPANYSQPGCNGTTCDATHSVQIKVGDVFADAANIFQEPRRVVQITTDSGNANYLDVVVERNASVEYNCIVDWQPSDGSCIASNSGWASLNGWQALALPRRLGGDTDTVFITTGQGETSTTVQEVGDTLLRTHGDLKPGVSTGTGTYVAGAQINGFAAAAQGPATTFLTFPITKLKQFPPTWAGSTLPIGSNGTQGYTTGNGTVPFVYDSNALNSGGVNPPEQASAYGTYTLATTASANVYRISFLTSFGGITVSTTDYKSFPISVTASRFALREVSGPSSNVAAAPYTYCFANASNECLSGSSAGQLFVNLPAVTTAFGVTCYVDANWFPFPCPIAKWPGAGQFRQIVWNTNEPFVGGNTRLMGYGLNIPGAQYVFSTLVHISNTIGWLPVTYTSGWGLVPFLVQPPTLTNDSSMVNRSGFISAQVSVASGHAFARVMFGMNANFYCKGSWGLVSGSLSWSGRAEACVTDNSSSPYKFVGESQTALACSSGCTIPVPLIPQTSNFLKIQYSTDGSTWTDGPVSTAYAGGIISTSIVTSSLSGKSGLAGTAAIH